MVRSGCWEPSDRAGSLELSVLALSGLLLLSGTQIATPASGDPRATHSAMAIVGLRGTLSLTPYHITKEPDRITKTHQDSKLGLLLSRECVGSYRTKGAEVDGAMQRCRRDTCLPGLHDMVLGTLRLCLRLVVSLAPGWETELHCRSSDSVNCSMSQEEAATRGSTRSSTASSGRLHFD